MEDFNKRHLEFTDSEGDKFLVCQTKVSAVYKRNLGGSFLDLEGIDHLVAVQETYKSICDMLKDPFVTFKFDESFNEEV